VDPRRLAVDWGSTTGTKPPKTRLAIYTPTRNPVNENSLIRPLIEEAEALRAWRKEINGMSAAATYVQRGMSSVSSGDKWLPYSATDTYKSPWPTYCHDPQDPRPSELRPSARGWQLVTSFLSVSWRLAIITLALLGSLMTAANEASAGEAKVSLTADTLVLKLDPGETGLVLVTLKNEGPDTVANIAVANSVEYGHVAMTDGPTTVTRLQPGEDMTIELKVEATSVEADLPAGAGISASFTVLGRRATDPDLQASKTISITVADPRPKEQDLLDKHADAAVTAAVGGAAVVGVALQQRRSERKAWMRDRQAVHYADTSMAADHFFQELGGDWKGQRSSPEAAQAAIEARKQLTAAQLVATKDVREQVKQLIDKINDGEALLRDWLSQKNPTADEAETYGQKWDTYKSEWDAIKTAFLVAAERDLN
jgi:hypothetical protein